MKQVRNRLRELKNRAKKLRVNTWILIVVLLPLGFAAATLLRLDHIRMSELRSAVLEVDAGITDDETDAEMAVTDKKLAESLVRLKEFTFSHIVVNVVEENGVQKVTFGTGPFYLEHQYRRAAARALEAAESKLTGDNNQYGNIYGAAGEVCRPIAIENGWAWNSSEYIDCMLTEIQKYPSSNEIQDTITASLPSTELFRHNYASPVWAPTPAGFVIIAMIIVVAILVWRLICWVVIRLALIFV